ncbi:T9SS type A sorting domain-containing protein [Pedobacter arcticus]|uniref:T9SS type A sorting domain-containing protein n=1 Tax=Pedobacter arcticus TaxID=752140 RepID=UPI0002D649CC|nr:T9SS type A sorting domain-containing protein [Pedobacter arcticus]
MRKLLLAFVAVIVGGYAYAQGPLTKNWEVKALVTGSLVGTASLQTTIAYNSVTEKLYLPEKNNKISILKPSDGTISSPATLTTLSGGAWAASYKYNKIRVTTAGVIYACNMTVPTGPTATTTAGTVYIYRWGSEADASPVTSAISVIGRTGDSFAVSGTGVNTIIYISGAANQLIYVCKTADGTNFVLDHTITLTNPADARSSISAVSNSLTSDLWINTLNVEAKRISSNAAGVVGTTSSIVTGLIDQKYANAEYIQEGSRKFLAVSGANDAVLGLDFKLYEITDFPTPNTAVTLVGSGVLAPAAYTANANAYADVAYKKNLDNTYTFFHLASNNGLAAYTTASALPVTLTSFAASFTNNQNSLTWSTASENNSLGFDVESSTDGTGFSKIGFVASKNDGNSSSALSYAFQDKSATAVTTYYRLKQVDKDGRFEYSGIRSVKNPLVDNQNVFAVYPNPTTDYVEIAGANTDGVTIQLFTTMGKEVNISNLLQGNRLDMTSLNAGIYVLRISENGQLLQTSKLVKK